MDTKLRPKGVRFNESWLYMDLKSKSTTVHVHTTATHLHDHEYAFICLDHMVELTHMLLTKIFHGIYFTLHSW